MTYRDDHEAALARADALDRELASERAEIFRDETRIAELEGQLRDARRQVPSTPREPRASTAHAAVEKKKAPWRMIIWTVGFLVVGLIGVKIFLWRVATNRERVAYGWDVDAYLASAFSDARGMESDAELQRFYGEYVDSAGFAQLAIGQGHLVYVFRSPHLAGDSPAPARLGAPTPVSSARCVIREEIYTRDTSLTSTRETSSDPSCGYSIPGPLHCSVVQIWKRAIGKGAPSSAVALISLKTRAPPVNREWRFEINGANFELTFPDDCAK